uniref:Uncharacterized protein n=1 Tax=Anguilla anguilla TaxID=7936 RepID=A0A0E9TV05_ANGAN
MWLFTIVIMSLHYIIDS